MKTLALCVVVYLLFFTDTLAFVHIDIDSWHMPLWLDNISWVGFELVGALAVIVLVVAILVLVTMGILGAVLVAGIGLVLAFLFGSISIAWPLLIAALLYWLIVDNKKVAS